MSNKRPPIHPGEILKEEFLDPLNITPEELAKDLGFPLLEITQFIEGKTSTTPELAQALGHCFDNGAEVWINLDKRYKEELEKRA